MVTVLSDKEADRGAMRQTRSGPASSPSLCRPLAALETTSTFQGLSTDVFVSSDSRVPHIDATSHRKLTSTTVQAISCTEPSGSEVGSKICGASTFGLGSDL